MADERGPQSLEISPRGARKLAEGFVGCLARLASKEVVEHGGLKPTGFITYGDVEAAAGDLEKWIKDGGDVKQLLGGADVSQLLLTDGVAPEPEAGREKRAPVELGGLWQFMAMYFQLGEASKQLFLREMGRVIEGNPFEEADRGDDFYFNKGEG